MQRVVGPAEVLRRYADRQTLGQHQTDGRLSKLTGINSHRGHETRSFWQVQSCLLGVSVIRVEVQCCAEAPPNEGLYDSVDAARLLDVLGLACNAGIEVETRNLRGRDGRLLARGDRGNRSAPQRG